MLNTNYSYLPKWQTFQKLSFLIDFYWPQEIESLSRHCQPEDTPYRRDSVLLLHFPKQGRRSRERCVFFFYVLFLSWSFLTFDLKMTSWDFRIWYSQDSSCQGIHQKSKFKTELTIWILSEVSEVGYYASKFLRCFLKCVWVRNSLSVERESRVGRTRTQWVTICVFCSQVL